MVLVGRFDRSARGGGDRELFRQISGNGVEPARDVPSCSQTRAREPRPRVTLTVRIAVGICKKTKSRLGTL